MARKLKQVRFNLDLNKPNEADIYATSEWLRNRREWQSVAVRAMYLYMKLKYAGDAEPLFEEFPHLRGTMQTYTPAPTHHAGGIEIGETSQEDLDDNLDDLFGALIED